MKVLVPVGVDGHMVILQHPARDEENDSTLEALFEDHQVDDVYDDKAPGIYAAHVVWGYSGNRNNPEDAGDGALTYLDNFELLAAANALPDVVAALEAVRYELAALVADPSAPDWMPALGNKNSADAECLQKAWGAATEALAALKGATRNTTIRRLCNLAPDDDGEAFEPYTDAELDAMNARMAAAPEASF